MRDNNRFFIIVTLTYCLKKKKKKKKEKEKIRENDGLIVRINHIQVVKHWYIKQAALALGKW